MQNFVTLPERHVRIEFFQYFIVILIGLLIDMGGLYIFITYTPVWYFLAAAISFMTAVLANYILASRYVFNTHTNPKHFSVFFLIALSTLTLNQLAMYIFVEYLLLGVILSKCLTLPFTFVWNFVWNKTLVFKNGKRVL